MARIAVVGTGISGLGSAYLLNPDHDITVYEKAARIGGHSRTVTVDYDGRPVPVDTGFIVFNRPNYPNLTGLFASGRGHPCQRHDFRRLDPGRLAGMGRQGSGLGDRPAPQPA